MSQTLPDTSDPVQYSCQCSTMDSTRASRGHENTKISSSQPQELPLGFEALQTPFEPVRRLESSQLEMLDVQIHSSQSDVSRHNSSCGPLNLDLSRQLAVQASSRVQEPSGAQDPQKTNPHGSSSDLTESGKSEVSAFAHRESSSKGKPVQKLTDRYQHYLPENCVRKHGENVLASGILEHDGLVNYQRHHHHGKGISHHHVPQHLHQHHHANQQTANSLVQMALSNPTPSSYSPTSIHRNSSNHQSANFDHYSSNPNLMKHEMNSPNVNNSRLSSTPLNVSHQHNSSGPTMNHASSGISCESSGTNARSHSRVDHVHDYHHHFHRHLQPAHAIASNQSDKTRDRVTSTADHGALHHSHSHKPQSHGHSLDTEAKCPAMGMDALQVQVSPSKPSKCQCHTLKEEANKRRGDDESVGVEVDSTSRAHQPPALPPRPPPRPAQRFDAACNGSGYPGEGGCCKKYVILCCLCGTLSAAVGSLFMAVHAVLSSHTASLALFETVPSYIPGTMLILMGFFTMLLARRKHRYGLLMKMCGSIGVVCALVCVLVTVTTTVVHMSRLQSLRECVYTARAKSCTCYGVPQSKTDPGVLFEGTPHCDVVHGALYMCLRALFGVSVAGILACIFSCMLVYQLLSHEKKKMYWEQLELRCRSLYGQGQGTVGPANVSCGCCNDCGGTSPWWAQTPGNLYTPNPDMAPSRRWRLPWSRSRGPAPSPDSNYGFHTQSGQTEISADSTTGPYSVLNSQSVAPYPVLNPQNNHYTSGAASYSVLEAPIPLWGPPPPYSDPNSPSRRSQVPEARPRVAKKMEHFEQANDCDTHRSRSAVKRPSDNYENAEEISNSTDPEGGGDETLKGRRTRRSLKGVENNAFQQEGNSNTKQSESELYFGDVSSCCGPESSFYDLAIEKEGIEGSDGSVDYLAAHLGKRQLSKRSRLPLPLPADGRDAPPENYPSNEEPRNEKGPFLAPDAQYEVIQQNRYASYYSTKKEDDLQGEELQSTSSYFAEEDERGREWEYRNLQEEETTQCCLSDTTTLDSGWQSGEQQQSDDNVRSINV